MAGLIVHEIVVHVVNINFPIHIGNGLRDNGAVGVVPDKVIPIGKGDQISDVDCHRGIGKDHVRRIAVKRIRLPDSCELLNRICSIRQTVEENTHSPVRHPADDVRHELRVINRLTANQDFRVVHLIHIGVRHGIIHGDEGRTIKGVIRDASRKTGNVEDPEKPGRRRG